VIGEISKLKKMSTPILACCKLQMELHRHERDKAMEKPALPDMFLII